ncbi:NADPH-dependent FMN reductase [Sphingomonas colocasiae]|uniref:NAD(P)H-dependent oxidoreductase n=1 Tax=Sphingomonas colocasiae TaxID=1848973 RepID=A0ABS7PMT4_9SPHN|nr:NADPH-dependent FMN reductase [Sphingomonas colocasiae]MBY8822627.1 NAD(P)H-dependent oxidoreductase [Sphingomonas colocasiae]
MTRIVGIAGSLRRQSFNLGLLRAAGTAMPEGATLDVHTIAGIPLYNADDEAASGLPASVVALKDAIANADGLILATPEYNNGIPGVFKNTIDWLSRPADDIGRVFGDRPVALIGASPGNFGTMLAQDAWLSVLRTLGTRPWFGGRLLASRAGGLFDGEGRLSDEAMRERLRAFMAGFVAFSAQGG